MAVSMWTSIVAAGVDVAMVAAAARSRSWLVASGEDERRTDGADLKAMAACVGEPEPTSVGVASVFLRHDVLVVLLRHRRGETVDGR